MENKQKNKRTEEKHESSNIIELYRDFKGNNYYYFFGGPSSSFLMTIEGTKETGKAGGGVWVGGVRT